MEGLKEKYPGLTHNRIPVCNSAAPLEPDFDTICNALCGTNVNTPVIVNCQVNCVIHKILIISTSIYKIVNFPVNQYILLNLSSKEKITIY